MKNSILESIVVTIAIMVVGGILANIGVAIFIPTYTYSSIKDFLIIFVFGGYGFITILGFLSCILAPLDNLK